jgi:hypothetical protein
MKMRIPAGAFALALGLGVASCSDTPTAPSMSPPESADLSRSGPKSRGQSIVIPAVAPMKNAAGAVVANFAGTFTVTKFGFDEATRQLLVTGVLSGTATYLDGVTPAATVNQTLTTTATLSKGAVASGEAAIYQFASAAACSILSLDLGPLHLDLLGLVIDLNQVVLDITGATGSGNLLGNLLCALTGLLDGAGALAGILNLLDSINNLLDAIGGLAAPAGLVPAGGFDATGFFYSA